MLKQNFGVTNKEHYGVLWYFLEGLAHDELQCGIPVEPHFVMYERKQNCGLKYLSIFDEYFSFSRLIAKYDNVLLKFTTTWLIRNYVSLVINPILDNCYYNSRQNRVM